MTARKVVVAILPVGFHDIFNLRYRQLWVGNAVIDQKIDADGGIVFGNRRLRRNIDDGLAHIDLHH